MGISCYASMGYAHDATSKTALANSQAPFSSVSPELIVGFRLDRTYACHDIRHGSVQVALFGGSSTHGTKEGLARYFFPQGKECLSVADDSLQDNFDKEKDPVRRWRSPELHEGRAGVAGPARPRDGHAAGPHGAALRRDDE